MIERNGFLLCLAALLTGCSEPKKDSGSGRPPTVLSPKPAYAWQKQSDGWARIRKKAETECFPVLEQQYTKYLYAQTRILAATLRTGQGCYQGVNPQEVHVQAYIIQAGEFEVAETPRWTIRDTGVEARVFRSSFLAIDESGCCASRDFSKYYSVDNGRYIGKGDVEPFIFERSRNDRRIILAESPLSASGSVRNYTFRLYLGNADGNLDSLHVDSTMVPALADCKSMFIRRFLPIEDEEQMLASLGLDCRGETKSSLEIHFRFEEKISLVETIPPNRP